jgi:uncharacterized protein with NRDE domain
MKSGKKSRGEVTRVYLAGDYRASQYLQQLVPHDQDYAGFNLLLGDSEGLWFYSNRNSEIERIAPGVYGVSNGGFDEPWPKLSSGKAELSALLGDDIDPLQLQEILTDHRIADDHELPDTGVPLDIERMLSSRFIRSPGYGTRACSVLIMDNNGNIDFREQNFTSAEHSGKLVQASIAIETN